MAEKNKQMPTRPGRTSAKPQNMGKTLIRLWKYMTRFRIQLILGLITSAFGSILMLAGMYQLEPLIDKYILPGDFKGLFWGVLVLAATYIFRVAFSIAENQLMMRLSQNTITSIRNDLFEHMQSLPIRVFDQSPHGELMSLFTNDAEALMNALEQSVTQLFWSAITFVGAFIMMFAVNWKIALIICFTLVIMVVITTQFSKRSRKYFVEQQEKIGLVNGYVEEMVEGQRVIKVFNHEQIVKDDFQKINLEYSDIAVKAQTMAGIVNPIIGNLNNINYAIIASVGGAMVLGGTFTLGGLTSFSQFARMLGQPLTQTSNQVNNILSAIAGVERIFAVLDLEPEDDDGDVTLVSIRENEDGILVEDPNADRSSSSLRWAWKQPKESGYVLVELCGDVRFHNVDFGYEKDQNVLKDLSLYAKPGQKIAFVGSTGAGKTTVTNLITRFYEIQKGMITYDGIDIKTIKKDALRQSLGMVLQDTNLFSGTIMENIRFGRLDATDEEVIGAAKLSSAHSFIKHLPQGYQTMISGNGDNLSQGQRQLLSIARTAVANPPVLILDEATSSIDTRTELLVERGMDALMSGRTVFVIAHRLSTVRNSNAIMVIEHGEIIERGDHDDLLKQEGRYYQLYTGQFELT